MVVIRRLALTLLGLIVLAMLAIFAGIFISDHLQKGQANSTDAALQVILSDPGLRQDFARYDNHYTVIYKQINDSSTKGFINYPGQLTGVYIQLTPPRGPPPLVNYYFIVDTNRSKIVDGAMWLDIPPYDDVIILPGTAWYHKVISDIAGWGGINASPMTIMRSSYTPADADVTQALVSEDGLYMLMNLSRTMPLRNIDVSKYVTVYNQTETQGPKWNATIWWPAVEAKNLPGVVRSSEPMYSADSNYYIVVINRETDREVSLSQFAFTGSTW